MRDGDACGLELASVFSIPPGTRIVLANTGVANESNRPTTVITRRGNGLIVRLSSEIRVSDRVWEIWTMATSTARKA